MKRIKPFLSVFLFKLRYFDLLKHFQKNRVIILMYHRFSDKAEPFKTHQSAFENQVKFLKKNFSFISLKHYSEILEKKRENLPRNPIILTIDDGYQDNYTFAYPILKKYSVPATIFLTTDFISKKAWLWPNKLEFILKSSSRKVFYFPLGKKAVQFSVDDFKNWHNTQLAIFNYCRTLPDKEKDQTLNKLARRLKVSVPEKTQGDFQPLSWDQIREMGNHLVHFGSHTCSHPILSRLTTEQLQYELIQSKLDLEENISSGVRLFCYPNGQIEDINYEAIQAVKSAGYRCAVTTVNGFNNIEKTNLFLLKRISISSKDNSNIFRDVTRLT